MCSFSSHPQLASVTFSGNHADQYGGGMVNWYSDSRLTNATFSGNQANDGGGMYNWFSDPQLVNVTFRGNYAADNGGGMDNDHSDPQMVNVTFSGNHADQYGGGMCNTGGVTGSSPTLGNCILWGNTAPAGSQIHNDAGTPTINYGLVQGGCPPSSACDPNLLDANPLFLRDPDSGDGDWTTPGDNDYGDLRLRSTSPAIDSGDNSALPADTLDLDGDGDTSEPLPLDLDRAPRRVDVPGVIDSGNGTPPIVDRGAFEHALINRWDGEAGTPNWSHPTNWSLDLVPSVTHQVWLTNTLPTTISLDVNGVGHSLHFGGTGVQLSQGGTPSPWAWTGPIGPASSPEAAAGSPSAGLSNKAAGISPRPRA
jgi:hypothetical protein